MSRDYKKIPIVDTARRCGLVLNPRTLTRGEVEASCPFCGDHGGGKYHLFLNTSTDQYRCVLCGAHGNSVTLYARVKGLSNLEAFRELEEGGNIYPMPKQPASQYTEAAPRPLAERSEIYSDMLGVASGDKNNMLGKLLYFSLSDLLIDKEKLSELCAGMGIYYAGDRRVSVSDAFKSATGDIKDRIIVKHCDQQQIYRVYCRDNEHTPRVLSRELVKETLNRETNQYEKLANISFDKESGIFSYDNLAYDSDVDAASYCRRAEELFELYQTCANRKQIETICLNYVRGLEATKMSVNGHLYFVPRHSMEKVDIFEDFMEALSSHNRTKSRLMANSIYIIDDAKQRDKMTEEFYAAVKKEIAEYQERADYLIKSGSQSPAIMERWVMKIGTLEGKKRHYEQVLRRELDGLDEEFESLKLLSQELSIRASGIRFQRAA